MLEEIHKIEKKYITNLKLTFLKANFFFQKVFSLNPEIYLPH